MSSIFFMALQCCQCSTMQVKQRKNNSKSNKWTCVVCNQKQSIRKVFARGPMAKDLRFFVQSFNMSRHSLSSQAPPTEEEPRIHGDPKRPRSDWTEFLDPDEEIPRPEPKPVGDFGPEIATELPPDFKKVKLNKYSGGMSRVGDSQDELYKPVFSKRNASKQVLFQVDKKPRQHHKGVDKKPRKCQITNGREASKWSQYVTREDDNDYDDKTPLFVGARKLAGPIDGQSNDLLGSLVNEEKVEEEEIHPDFL